MKCQMCNGEGGKIPHPEKYGSYREDCPACHGTGKQSPVDKIPVCPRCESINQCQYCGHCTKCCSIRIESLETKLKRVEKSKGASKLQRWTPRIDTQGEHNSLFIDWEVDSHGEWVELEDATTIESELSAARGEIEHKRESISMLVLDAKRLEAEKERLKALIEEILVENVGCTELRDLYRRKVRGGK